MTTEELKREMYGFLEAVKSQVRLDMKPVQTLQGLEESLEAYLERLRTEAAEHARVLIDKCDELGTARLELAAMRKERDEIQDRMHAVDHAYNVQSTANTVAGDMLRKAMDTIRRQQGFIRTLYASRKARKTKGATSTQKKK